MRHDMKDAQPGLIESFLGGRGRWVRWPERQDVAAERPCNGRPGRRSPGRDVPYRLIVVREGVGPFMPMAFEASPTGPAHAPSPTTAVSTAPDLKRPSILLVHERYR